MNVSTIEMPREVAEAKLAAYRDALRHRHSEFVDEEYRAAVRGFEELAKGTVLIDPRSTVREAGWRADGRPVLAIARADQHNVTWSIERDSRHYEHGRGWYGRYAPMTWRFSAARSRSANRSGNLVFRVDEITSEPPVSPKSGTAMIPMVPPDVITDGRGCDLSKHFILWEVESWDLAPPIDPMLLKRIGGDLYAVVAQWDLTELERRIIAGTRRDQ